VPRWSMQDLGGFSWMQLAGFARDLMLWSRGRTWKHKFEDGSRVSGFFRWSEKPLRGDCDSN